MRRAEPQRAPEPVIEEGLLPHIVGLQASTPLDGSLPGVSLKAAGLLAWHPTRQRLLVASPVAAVEYDAVSGARRNLVEVAGTPLHVTYTPSGSAIILLTKERGIFFWSTSTWKRRVLLPPDSKYAGKQLAAGLLAVSSGQHPVVYWTPLGKNTVRMVNTAPVEVPKGGKLEREMVPGVKLKTENKKPIVGLAVHPTERGTLFVLLADASLHVCSVSGATIATLSTFPIPGINPAAERVAVHAWPHPILPGAAMLAVEAAVGGISILEHAPRQEPRLLGTLAFGAGSTMCGVGLLSSGLLCAAGRHASGNVQVQAWELAGDSRELQVLPTTLVPALVWDAMQGLAGKAALADVSGDSLITRLHFQQASGAVAVATVRRGGGGEPAHQRVPLLHLINGPEGAGAPQRLPLHTGLGFWTARDSGDSTVSKLRFPRYAHVISGGRVCNYDLTHGMLSDCLVLPPTNSAGQERLLVRAVRSTRQPAWLAFARVLSRRPEGAVLGPGQCEFALVSDSDAALTSGQWMIPGADGVFVGAADDTVAVLANSGRCLVVYETARLGSAGAAAKPLFSAELREGLIAAVHAGPPAHIPSPPLPSPVPPPADGDQADSDDSDAGEDDASRALRQEWEEGERARLQPPRLVLLQTQSNLLVLAEVSSGAASYAGKARQLPTRASLALRRSEVLLQVAWQSLVPPDGSFHSGSEGAGSAAAAVAAVLTSQRVLLLTERLVLVASAAIPPDLGLPVSCLWVGPALLVSTSTGQVLQVCWDGKLVHVCSLLQGTAPALLGALADRLLVATKPSPAGRVEVGGRGVNILQPLLLGWVSLVQRHLLPGGAARARRELRTLVASYDASHLGVTALERLAAAGFADVAAAVAASSDSAAITPAHKAVFQAAAGDWQPLLLLVMQEWEGSSWHPGPPPRSSQLYARMVALARTCQQYGRFSDARQLLEGAGAHGELMALCVFQGDFSGLQAHARKGGRDAERLADQLMAVNENAFVHGSTDGSLFGGRANTDDWTVTVAAGGEAEGSVSRRQAPAAGSGGVGGAAEAAESVPGGGAGSGPMEVEVAPAGRLPFQEASLQVLSAANPAAPAPGGDLEGQPIEGLDLATLSAYVGLSGAHVIKPAVSTPTASSAAAAAPALGGGVSLSRMETGLSELSNPLEPELAAAIGASRAVPRGGWESGSEGRPAVGRDETTAQAAARAAFRRDTADDEDDFFSSDEESAPTEADSRSVASMTTNSAAPGGSQRFRISIKPADEAAAAGAAAARPDTGMLRTAALSLRLGGMSLSGSADSTPFSTSRSAASLGSAARPGTLPPLPTSSATSGAAPPLAVKASTGSGPDGQAPSSSVSGDDPFAGLFGLQAPQAQQPGTKAAPPPPPPAAAAASGPMRPPAAPAAQQSNLLSGWDDFESLFAAVPATGQQQQQQQQQQPGIDLFGPVSFPPLPPPASTPLQPPAGSPAKPSAGAPAPAAAPAVEGPTMRRSGSVAELAPAAAKKAVDGGLAAFQAGQWQAAASSFGTAMDKAGITDPAFAQQALLLYVAARLLDAAAAAAKKAQAATAARLARFALALPLEDAQRLAAVAYAVEANMAARNYGFAADQLTWLIIQSTSGAGGLDAMALQDKLNACDRAGGGNGALPRDEDRESFAAIVSSCSQRGEAEELVGNIISAG